MRRLVVTVRDGASFPIAHLSARPDRYRRNKADSTAFTQLKLASRPCKLPESGVESAGLPQWKALPLLERVSNEYMLPFHSEMLTTHHWKWSYQDRQLNSMPKCVLDEPSAFFALPALGNYYVQRGELPEKSFTRGHFLWQKGVRMQSLMIGVFCGFPLNS